MNNHDQLQIRMLNNHIRVPDAGFRRQKPLAYKIPFPLAVQPSVGEDANCGVIFMWSTSALLL